MSNESIIVDMHDVIDDLSVKLRLSYTTLEGLEQMTRYAIRAYRVDKDKLTFTEICELVHKFVQTPWGYKVCRELCIS